MNTQSHMLMGAVLFGRRIPGRAWFGVLGGLLPDLPMIIAVLTLKLGGVSDAKIFGQHFFEDWWQVSNAIGHSFILWGGLLSFGLLRQWSKPAHERWALANILSASALLHSVIDFLCHRQDAHMHFWPLTRWKFVSPISYYDPAHFGVYFSLFEASLGIVMAVYLIYQYRNKWASALLASAMLVYAAVPLYFVVVFRVGHQAWTSMQ